MDDKMRILKMVEDGTITAEQAAELLKALGADEDMSRELPANIKYDKKMFRIVVDSTSGDKVNIQFPVGAVRKILKATGKLPIPEKNLEGLDIGSMMEAVSECLDEEVEGDFVNVSASDGTVVRIYVDK